MYKKVTWHIGYWYSALQNHGTFLGIFLLDGRLYGGITKNYVWRRLLYCLTMLTKLFYGIYLDFQFE